MTRDKELYKIILEVQEEIEEEHKNILLLASHRCRMSTALQSYMEREIIKARLDEIEPYVKYVYTSNTAQNNAYERKKDLQRKLKEQEKRDV